MDISTINQTVANLNVKYATIKDKELSFDNVKVSDEIIDSLKELLDSIANTKYTRDDIQQVLGLLRGPIKTLVIDIKTYNKRVDNLITGYEFTQARLKKEAQLAFEENNKTESNSFNEFINQEPTVEAQQQEQTNQPELQQSQIMVKKLVPETHNQAA